MLISKFSDIRNFDANFICWKIVSGVNLNLGQISNQSPVLAQRNLQTVAAADCYPLVAGNVWRRIAGHESA
jgi:hypothetical protein